MNTLALRGLSAVREQSSVLSAFAAALFLSALLLFSIQPIFAKMVLPKLGGAPSVWAVSMVFFQAILLAGYAYAHALNRWCPHRQAPLAHLALMALAACALPFGLPAFGAEPPAGDAYFWLICVLTVGVGLPFFAVSANAPLLQSWFARSGHPQAADPYFLYAASNLGSLMTLLAYPFLVEPVIGLSRQAGIWTNGFLALGLLIAICGFLVMPARDEAAPADPAETAAPPLAWSQCLAWVWLAAIPSGLLVAFTSYVTTDVASAPFLWVIPLAVFLGTFILVFRDKPVIPHHWMVWSQPLLVAMTLLGLMTSGATGWVMGAWAGFAAFFATTMICHKELYDLRPDRRNLTAFYTWMSFGGVIGGVFAALVAPQIFNAIYEFPLLLLAGLASRAGIAQAWADRGERRFSLVLAAPVAASVLGLALMFGANVLAQEVAAKGALVVILACGAYLLIASGKPLRQAAMAATMGLSLFALPSAMNIGFSERSFFGVHRVGMHENEQMRVLMHGTTLHGAMRVKDAAGNTVEAPLPATYYYPGSPMARGVEIARAATGKAEGGLVVGSVGVGSGSMACYSRANEDWRFYEIDPLVVKLATNPKLFTFFSRCRPDAQFVMGDARLTLAKAPVGTFDYLVIDAFASDSIPVHLLTREAVTLYLSRLSANGLLALHISNQHMDLVDVTTTLARSLPHVSAVIVRDQPAKRSTEATPSHVMFLAKSPDVLAGIRTWVGATPVAAAEDTAAAKSPWTDDYSNVLGAILRQRGLAD
jgi:hypothetical protein